MLSKTRSVKECFSDVYMRNLWKNNFFVQSLVIALLVGGCSPSLKYYLRDTSSELHDDVVFFGKPTVPLTIGVANFTDSRPLSERFDAGVALRDTILVGASMGLAAIAFSAGQEGRAQPFDDLDSAVPDYLGCCVQDTGCFSEVKRINCRFPMGDLKRMKKNKTLAGVDLILTGDIKRFTGYWEFGDQIKREERMVAGGKEIVTTYSLLECYGIVDMSVQIIDLRTQSVIWSKDFETRSPYGGSIYLSVSSPHTLHKNLIAAETFKKTLIEFSNALSERDFVKSIKLAGQSNRNTR